MSRRPSMQFYPADWAVNKNLKRCSHAEKGMWMDILCLMHDSEEYGVLRWPLVEIARAVGATVPAINGLVRKQVMRGCDIGVRSEPLIYVPRSGRRDGAPVTLLEEQEGPIFFSSRMVKDEYIRNNAGASTRFGMPPVDTKPAAGCAPSRSPSHRDGEHQGDGSSSSSSSSSSLGKERLANANPKKNYDAEFAEWWLAYPEKVSKGTAETAYVKARSLASAKQLIEGVQRYVATKPADRAWAHAATWLNGKRWLDQPAGNSRSGIGDETDRIYREMGLDL